MEKKKNASILLQFSDEIIKLPKLIIEGLLKSTSDEDIKNVINSYSKPLTNQFNQLSQMIKEAAGSSSLQQIKNAEDLITSASGIELVKAVEPMSKNLKSIFGKLGLNSIIKEIKKLVLFILDMLNVKPWIIDLILIIDQILNALLGLSLPTTLPALLSKSEEGYLNELTAHFKLKQARSFLFDSDAFED